MTDKGSGEPRAEPMDARAIDRAVLGEWLGDDNIGINSLLTVFQGSIHTEFASLRTLLEGEDMVEFARTAHRLQGAAMAMGARVLGETAAILDAAAQAGYKDQCAKGMAGLEREIHRMDAEIPG